MGNGKGDREVNNRVAGVEVELSNGTNVINDGMNGREGNFDIVGKRYSKEWKDVVGNERCGVEGTRKREGVI